jgi:hypothetical protein
MRGIKDSNFPEFDKNRDYLKNLGWDVISPADLDRKYGVDWTREPTEEEFKTIMRHDYAAMLECDAIAFLLGWQASKGAQLEFAFAKQLDLEMFSVDADDRYCVRLTSQFYGPPRLEITGFPPQPKSPFLQVVDEIVAMHNKKQQDYGTDEDPLANVRSAADVGVEPWIGVLIRMGDKMRRLHKAAKGGKLANESVEDSMLDMAVYSIIDLVLYREVASK